MPRTRSVMRSRFSASCVVTLAAILNGCAGGHGNYTTEGLNAAQQRMAVIKSGTQWDMARQQFLAGDLKKALKSVDNSIEINDSVTKAHTLRGRILMELGQLEAAGKEFHRALELDASFVDAHYYLAILHERFNEPEEALAEYQAAAALEPSDAQYLIAASEMLMDLGRLDEAEQLLESRSEDFQHNPGVHQTLGHLAMIRGDADKAVKLFDEARLLAPDDHSILEDLAVAQMQAEKFVEAEYTLRQLLKDPERADRRDLKRLRARCLVSLDRPVEAREILLSLTSDDDGRNDIDAWVDLGQVALMLGDRHRVQIAAARVVALAPTRFEGPLLAALWKRAKGDLPGALKSATRAVTLAASSDPTPMVVRGAILREMGRLDEAEESFVKAIAIDPSDTRARSMLAAVGTDQ